MISTIIIASIMILSPVNAEAISFTTLEPVNSAVTSVSNIIDSTQDSIVSYRTKSADVESFPKSKTVEIDNRAEKIDTYFTKRNAPLAGYGDKFVEVADKYNIDWRLLPAIGVRESSGGKRLLNNNPFGWGSCKIAFADFNEAIEVVGMNLAGENPNTARYYGMEDTYEKLYWYNGTVIPAYPSEVIAIMDMIEKTEIEA